MSLRRGEPRLKCGPEKLSAYLVASFSIRSEWEAEWVPGVSSVRPVLVPAIVAHWETGLLESLV